LEDSEAVTRSNRFWNPYYEPPRPWSLEFDFDSLEEAVAASDLIVRGRITDISVAEMWRFSKDEPGVPHVYLTVEVAETLKGTPLSRTNGYVEVQFEVGEGALDVVRSRPQPQHEHVFFLMYEPAYRESIGKPPRETEVAPFAYFMPNRFQGAIRDIEGTARIIDPIEVALANELGHFPLPLDGQPYEDVLEQIRQSVEP
jgi:hypothetical protein